MTWRFKNLQKAQDAIIIYFTETANPLWANIHSVTIPIGDAETMLKKLQTMLHPGGKSGGP